MKASALWLLSSLFVSMVIAPAWAERSHEITIEDYFSLAYVTDVEVSPDGKKVAYAEWRWDGPGNPRDTDLWIIDADGTNGRRLTFDSADENLPRWSVDGTSLFYLSGPKREGEKKPPYDGKAQIWRLDLATGLSVPLTNVGDGIKSFSVSPSGKTLFYMTTRTIKPEEWKSLREELKNVNYGEGSRTVSVLSALSLEDWRVKKVYDGGRYIRGFDVSSEEDRIALVTVEDSQEINSEGKSILEVFDIASGKSRVVPDELWRAQAPSPYGWLEHPKWAPGGDHIAMGVGFDGYPAQLILVSLDGDQFKTRTLKQPTDASIYLGGGLAWTSPGPTLSYLADIRGTRRVLSIVDPTGEQTTSVDQTPGELAVDDVSFSRDGAVLVTLESTFDAPREIFIRQLGSGEKSGPTDAMGTAGKRITRINGHVDTWKLPALSRVTWKGANGDIVEGLLELPPDHTSDKPLATIVNLHGGPTGCDLAPLQLPLMIYGRTLLAARGYAVLYVNYRGSTGYGDKFMTDLIGHENEIEVDDILRGVEHLIKQKIADENRLGVMGWSNGGYLTNCLITGTNRFAAASSGAGVFDMTIQWGEEDTPGHVINYMKGLPWIKPEEYQRASPVYHIGKTFRTATLIHVGEGDERVPATHSRALFRALRHYVKAPTELILYPDAGHTIVTYEHRLAKMNWDLAWFDKYLPK